MIARRALLTPLVAVAVAAIAASPAQAAAAGR